MRARGASNAHSRTHMTGTRSPQVNEPGRQDSPHARGRRSGGELGLGEKLKKTRFRVTLMRQRIDLLQHNVLIPL